ncbi:TonB-dependent receptor [Rubricoccus marinus]|uniref:TonB-dependent receptor n=1 Tax=Rubricoccus marinus TaxID=716817 RepID=UPI001C52A26D|nr:TonB-dependent receptor [Rubricoccus marinus]
MTDGGTGEPIPGANVIVVETGQGAAADIDGYYTVLNVSPQPTTIRVSALGYTEQVIEGIDVNIGQTATVNVTLREEDLGIETIVVRAERPVVETDVSNSRSNISAAEIESLPVSSVASVVGLQAGVQGLSVRGSGSDEISFQVNGLTLRDERNNSPYSTVPLSSVQEVQVQTGGFNAEYGNVRSGVVNVITKDGSRDTYEVDVTARLSPATQKNSGILANDPDSYWIRPFLDPEVSMMGTDQWSPEVRRQYAPFGGWIARSEELLRNDDPTDDLSPEALQQAFLWQHRKSFEITAPDYDLDIGFGGPVPLLSKSLGGLRFFGSYRRDQDLYMIPLHTDRYTEQTGHLKVTSNLTNAMKLSLEGRLGNQAGTGASRTGQPGFFRSNSGIAGNLDAGSGFIDSRIFSGDYWGPSEVTYNQLGGTLTHSVSNKTFYELRVNRFESRYDTNPGRRRDTATDVVTFGGVGFDEAPFGWQPFNEAGFYSTSTGVDGMRMGVGMSNARDSSRVAVWNLKGDLTSQLNRFMEVKTGLEYNLTRSQANYASIDSALTGGNEWSQWDRSPIRAAVYGQTKLEFGGMIANIGLRGDYTDPRGEWYEFTSFDPRLAVIPTQNGDPRPGLDTLLTTVGVESQFNISPRLGVSFPVTSVSKLFFNYGHFRAVPDPDDLFLVRVTSDGGQLSRIGNPNAPLPKTVAYELGYEQSFFDQYLVRLAGYYKDVSLQPFSVNYQGRGSVDYLTSEPNSYEDIRGFEITLRRNRGRWIQGFVNYTYSVFTSGYFGFPTIFENPSDQRQQAESDAARRNAQSEAQPRPFARANIDLLVPEDFGPNLAGLRPLADWRVSFIGRWQDGGNATWVGLSTAGTPDIQRNVGVKDFWSLDLRFARNFNVAGRRVSFFADVFNMLDRKDLSGLGYVDGTDRTDYYRSLHFPESSDYTNVPGNDQVGDFRDPDVAFQPICSVPSRSGFGDCQYNEGTQADQVPNPNVIYYERETGAYSTFENGEWRPVDESRLQEVLDTKAYIDMPNQSFLNFISPRDVFVGLRISL